MATLTVTDISRSGVVLTLTAAAGGGDEFANDGKTMFVVTNGGVGSITVTFVTQTTVDGLAVADKTVTVTAGQTQLAGPFPTASYNVQSGASSGRVQVTYSGVTSVTVNPFRLTPE